jgi:hypothetical protein
VEDVFMNREITLMLYTDGYDDVKVNKLKEFCDAENIPLNEIGFRGRFMYDFKITGGTKDYMGLKGIFGKKLKETSYAQLGNVFDFDADDFGKWTDILDRYYYKVASRDALLDELCEMVLSIKDAEKLEHILMYPLDNSAKEMLQDRIATLKCERCSWENWIHKNVERDQMIRLLEDVRLGEYTLKDNDICALIDILCRVRHEEI